jgi:hypothetical protein
MEPISAILGGIVTFLGSHLAKNKSVKSFATDFIDTTISEVRPIFLKEETPTPVLQQLAEKPESPARRSAAQSMLEIELEEQPELEAAFRTLFQKIQQTEEGATIANTIINGKNIVTGSVGGSVIQGNKFKS